MYDKIYICEDDSYIVEKNGLPYHIYNGGDYADEYCQLVKYIADNNIQVDRYMNTPLDIDMNKQEVLLSERASLLETMDRRVRRYKEQEELGIPNDDTYECYLAMLRYKQYLRDITKDPNFPNIEIKPFQENKE